MILKITWVLLTVIGIISLGMKWFLLAGGTLVVSLLVAWTMEEYK